MKVDPKFTRIAGDFLATTRDLCEWGIKSGLTTPDQLRLTVIARQQEAKRLIENGVSRRKAAKMLGVSESTIREDVRGNRAKRARKSRTNGKPKTEKKYNLQNARSSLVIFSQQSADLAGMFAHCFKQVPSAITNDAIIGASKAADAWKLLADQLKESKK
jgi:DNA-binding CsgD family transcriptional regulator